MKFRGTVLMLSSLLSLTACQKPAPPAREPATDVPAVVDQNAPLYKRLGGYEAIAAVTDNFLSRMLGDPKIAAYFENVDEAGKRRVRQMIVDQLCAATGGPCVYVGADMATAHKDLHISDRAFAVAAQYLAETLDQFKVPPKEKTDLLAIVAGTKNDIVGK